MKTFKTGTPVKLIQPTIEGVVVGGSLAEDGESINYRVLYRALDGSPFVRFFSANELEEVPDGGDKEAILAKHEEHVAFLKKGLEKDLHQSKVHAEVKK